MKRIFFAMALMMSLLFANAQENVGITIQHTSYYEKENQLQHLTTLELYNSGTDTLCIWIEDSLKGTLPIEKLMTIYFYGPTYYESLAACMNDCNVSFSTCRIGNSFFKMLNPDESFSFAFISSQDNTEYVRQFIDRNLMICSTNPLLPYNKHNRIEYPLKQIVLSCP